MQQWVIGEYDGEKMVCVGQEVLGFTKLILKSKVEPNLDFEIPIQFCNPKSNSNPTLES